MGSEPVGPEGLGPELDHKGDPHGKPGGGGGRIKFVFIDVIVTGGVKTEPADTSQQMELVRKPGIIKLRANSAAESPSLRLRIDMHLTLAAATATLENFDENCEWLGPATKDERNVAFAKDTILPFILVNPAIDRWALVVFDENAGESEDNSMAIFPIEPDGSGFGVKKGSPTVTVLAGNITTDAFVIAFGGGVIGLAGLRPGDKKEDAIHLACKIFDVITFTVKSKTG